MTIEDFLQKYVEGYLFHDLENMAKIELPPDQPAGACGYPMLAATLAGMELLGTILSRDKFSKDPQKTSYLLDYWNGYLSEHKPQYKPFGPLFKELVRHGLAHTFLAKPGVLVTKGRPGTHLRWSSNPQQIVIDAIELYRDFETSYWERVKSLAAATNPRSADMRARLNEMIGAYSRDADLKFNKLSPPTEPSKPFGLTIDSTAGSESPPRAFVIPYSGGTPSVTIQNLSTESPEPDLEL